MSGEDIGKTLKCAACVVMMTTGMIMMQPNITIPQTKATNSVREANSTFLLLSWFEKGHSWIISLGDYVKLKRERLMVLQNIIVWDQLRWKQVVHFILYDPSVVTVPWQ